MSDWTAVKYVSEKIAVTHTPYFDTKRADELREDFEYRRKFFDSAFRHSVSFMENSQHFLEKEDSPIEHRVLQVGENKWTVVSTKRYLLPKWLHMELFPESYKEQEDSDD